MSLRVGFYRNVPEMYDNCYRTPQLDRLTGCPYPGWCVEIIQFLANSLNYSIQPVINSEKTGSVDWGIRLDNGTWTGTLGAIERGLVDTVCLMFQPTNLRSQYFDFSTSVVSVSYQSFGELAGRRKSRIDRILKYRDISKIIKSLEQTKRNINFADVPLYKMGGWPQSCLLMAKPVFLVRQPDETFNDYMWKVFRTFETQLWFLFVFVVAVQCGVMIVCYWLESEVMGIQNRFQPLASAWQLFRFFIVQPHGRYRRYTYAGNILMCVCAIATLLFTSLYQGLLLTRLLDPADSVPFTTSDQMIRMLAEKKYTLITNYRNNWFFDELQNSNWSYFAQMREAVKNNPIKYVGSVEEALDEVENGNYIYPTQEDSYTMFEAHKRCSLVYVDNAIPSLFVSFAFKKGSRLMDAWNRAMINTQTFQIKTFDKYMRDLGYLANPQRCTEKTEKSADGPYVDKGLCTAIKECPIKFVYDFVRNLADGVGCCHSEQKKIGQSLPASDLTGAFILMLIGTSTAVLVLFIEFYVKKRKRD